MVKLNDDFPLSDVVWTALAKIGAKQQSRDALLAGAKHHVRLNLRGEVDGAMFEQKVESIVSVGMDQTKAASSNPQVTEVIAYLLAKMNAATRSKVCETISEEFAANENQLPPPDAELMQLADSLLKKLRTSKTVTARGPVKCEFTLVTTDP